MTGSEPFDPQSLVAWLTRLESLHPKNIELGLDRVKTVFNRLALDFSKQTIITVAGTNGKGSVSCLIEMGLQQQGRSTACYSSPHLYLFNERLRINGKLLLDSDWVNAFITVDEARQDIQLTFFEYTSLAALLLIHQSQVDYAVLEIGLGGRLDAVNIIDADFAVITSIDMDHQDWLGDSIESIAKEKLGIVKPNSCLVCGASKIDAVLPEFIEISRVSYCINENFFLNHSKESVSIQLSSGTTIKDVRSRVHPVNFAIALQTLELILPSCSIEDLSHDLSNISLLGRQSQHTYQGINVIVDVAHNEQAISRLCESLTPIEGRTVIIFALLKDKNLERIIELLKPKIDAWFITELPRVSRAIPATNLAQILQKNAVSMVSVNKNPRQAFARACQLLTAKDRIIVAGSFHHAGDILAKIYNKKELPIILNNSSAYR